jgi:hypothetical protein
MPYQVRSERNFLAKAKNTAFPRKSNDLWQGVGCACGLAATAPLTTHYIQRPAEPRHRRDVKKRIAAPMIGGMVSSTILTLLVIPVVYFVWRGWSLACRKDESRYTVHQ